MNESLTPYLVTATDARGRRDTFAREAASIEHLRNVLEREGYRDIELLDDELSAKLRQQRPEEARPASAADYRLEARLRHGDRATDVWLMALRKNALPLLAAAAAIGWGAWSGSVWWILGGVVFVAVWILLVRGGRRRAGSYEDLLRAFARGEFEAASTLIERLRADRLLAGNEQLQADLDFRAASIQARAGDVAGALASVDHHRHTPHGEGGMFESRVASIHYLAGDMPAFIDAMEQCYAAAGGGQVQRLDLAFAHARVGDPARARELLEGVDRRNLSTLHKPVAVAVEGLLARREDDEDGAALLLTDALAGLSPFAANPAAWPVFGILVGHQALALARSGDHDEARAALEGWHEVVDACLDAESREALAHAMKS